MNEVFDRKREPSETAARGTRILTRVMVWVSIAVFLAGAIAGVAIQRFM